MNSDYKIIADCYVRGLKESKLFAKHVEGAKYFCITRTEEHSIAGWLKDNEWVGITPNRFRLVLRKRRTEEDPFIEK